MEGFWREIVRSAARVLPLAVPALMGCRTLEQIPTWLRDADTPRERYEARLDQAGLLTTALGRDWMAAAATALADAPRVAAPHVEQGYLSPSEPAAIALRVDARRGQQVVVAFELLGDTATSVFLDAWHVDRDSVVILRHAASADSGQRKLTLTPRQDGEITVRVQPELLRGGRFSLDVRVLPTLAFPVDGGQDNDIGSRFGAPRDGGVRRHHGIDIFAARGTAVVAAADAEVRRVETTPRGGNVVWLRDAQGHSLYYAHLDRFIVPEGVIVRTGDTIGFVGNSGNAITTPPHLHFGIYRRGEGPIDPSWFVRRPRGQPARLVADTAAFGQWMRTPRAGIALQGSPDSQGARLVTLERHTPVRVVAAVGEWYRVRLPDGQVGYLAARAIESADRPLTTAPLARPAQILTRHGVPAGPDDVLTDAPPGDSVAVLGRFAGYQLVRVSGGIAGWIVETPASTEMEPSDDR